MSDNLIGNEIVAHCGKCKSDTLHLITAVNGAQIDKVLCKICLSYHRYKLPKNSTNHSKQKKRAMEIGRAHV